MVNWSLNIINIMVGLRDGAWGQCIYPYQGSSLFGEMLNSFQSTYAYTRQPHDNYSLPVGQILKWKFL